jgi:DNA-directed RNA polymerase subunit RPC12/RpoP
MNHYEEQTGIDWLKSGAMTVAYLVVVGALALAWWPSIFVAGPLGLLGLFAWHHARNGYRCLNCGNEFEINTWGELAGPNGIGRNPHGSLRGWKLLRCPRCGQRTRATRLHKV